MVLFLKENYSCFGLLVIVYYALPWACLWLSDDLYLPLKNETSANEILRVYDWFYITLWVFPIPVDQRITSHNPFTPQPPLLTSNTLHCLFPSPSGAVDSGSGQPSGIILAILWHQAFLICCSKWIGQCSESHHHLQKWLLMVLGLWNSVWLCYWLSAKKYRWASELPYTVALMLEWIQSNILSLQWLWNCRYTPNRRKILMRTLPCQSEASSCQIPPLLPLPSPSGWTKERHSHHLLKLKEMVCVHFLHTVPEPVVGVPPA